MSLKIYRISEKYVSFLYHCDNRVQLNKGQRRPYVGVVLEVGAFKYFVPMESPKPNHKNLKSSVHFMPIANGEYGILGFNNMLPVPDSALVPYNIDLEKDSAYRNLLINQLAFIRSNETAIRIKASKTYYKAVNSQPDSFFCKICCDFKKLERASKRYDPNS